MIERSHIACRSWLSRFASRGVLFASLLFIASRAPTPAAEMTGPTPSPKALPAGVICHMRTARLPVLSQNLSSSLHQMSRGDVSGPQRAPLADLYDDVRKRQTVLDIDSQRLGQLVASVCKVPVDKRGYFLDESKGVHIIVSSGSKKAGSTRTAVLVPVRHFAELVAFWRGHEVVSEMVTALKDEVFRIAMPRYEVMYLKSAGTSGVVIARDLAFIVEAADLIRDWQPETLRQGADLQIRLHPGRLRDSGWLPASGTTRGQGDGSAFSRHVRALTRLPSSLYENLGPLLQTSEDLRADLYFTKAGVMVEAEAIAAPQSRFASILAGVSQTRQTYSLLAALPKETVAAFSVPQAQALGPVLKPVVQAGILDQVPARGEPKPIVLHLSLLETLQRVRGELCVGYVRGTLREINLLLAFVTESNSSARGYVRLIEQHLAGAATAEVRGRHVVIGVGLAHQRLAVSYADAIESGSERYAEGRRSWTQLWDKAFEPFRQVAFVTAEPLDLCQSLIGETMLSVQLHGMPMPDGVQKILDRMIGTPARGHNPLTLGFGGAEDRLRLLAYVPLGSAMDVARMMNGFTYALDRTNKTLPEQEFRRLLQSVPVLLLRGRGSEEKRSVRGQEMAAPTGLPDPVHATEQP